MRAAAVVILAACGAPDPGVSATASRAPELDAVFHQDPRWLGGDAAYSMPVHDGRTLWLFGDSFIATSDAHVRTESRMVRNSIGLMKTDHAEIEGATMQFAWREDTEPRSFFPEEGDHWFWPTNGIFALFADDIYLFLNEVRPTPGEGLGFAAAGFRAVHITTAPHDDPTAWPIETLPYRGSSDDGVACVGGDAETHTIFVITTDGRVLSWPADQLAREAPSSARAEGLDPGSECSIYRDDATGLWLYVWSRGFGDTTLAMKTAPSPQGPWSETIDLLKPPESMVANAFVYAGKAHPFVTHGGQHVITFADNSFTFGDLFDPAKVDTLYWPHVAVLQIDD